MYPVSQRSQDDPAQYSVYERSKLINLYIPSFSAGVNQKVFFQPDEDIENGLVTGITFEQTTGATPSIALTWYDGIDINSVLFGVPASYTLCLCDAKGNFLVEHLPVASLIYTRNAGKISRFASLPVRLQKSYVNFCLLTSGASAPFYMCFNFIYHPRIR